MEKINFLIKAKIFFTSSEVKMFIQQLKTLDKKYRRINRFNNFDALVEFFNLSSEMFDFFFIGDWCGYKENNQRKKLQRKFKKSQKLNLKKLVKLFEQSGRCGFNCGVNRTRQNSLVEEKFIFIGGVDGYPEHSIKDWKARKMEVDSNSQVLAAAAENMAGHIVEEKLKEMLPIITKILEAYDYLSYQKEKL
ncbi:MAG: hypothetical protein MUF50_04585 [Planctomycetes bacterium]|jgi:hypothetical protein|nr:hypothetical protein [Planctomycetota bacterium]